jgi:hypothetical protein
MRKTFIRFFTIADYEEEETWLREQHRRGWRLARVTPPCFYSFEACEPEDVIYRLDYKNNTQTGEYMCMMADFGWESCGQCIGWLYFRKPAAEAQAAEDGELFSDNASRADMVSRIVKTRLLPLTVIFLCCVLPNFIRYAGGHDLSPIGLVFTGFFSVMFIIYVFMITHCGLKLRKIREKYREP